MIPGTADIVIIGGGIIGTSIAYHLALRKAGRIVLLEKGLLGEGSTSRCLGGVRLQFSTEINLQFSLLAMQAFEHFEEEFGVDPGLKRIGYLFLATTPGEVGVFTKSVDLQRRYGVPVEYLNPGDVSQRWPFLKTDDVLGGSFCARDGYAGPSEVLDGFAKAARRTGVEIHERTEAFGILSEGRRISGVCTAEGTISCPLVVNAAGPDASTVGRMVGLEIPVKPLRRQVFVTAPFRLSDRPVPLTIDFHNGSYFRQELDGFLLSGALDKEPSHNLTVDYEGMAEAAEHAAYRVPDLEKARIVRGWAGLYEISPDNHAILGLVPQIEGLVLANGFSGHGFQHSPAVGKLIAELIVDGRTTSLDISSLSIERFRMGKLILEPLTAFRE
jgi:sarcosine oxidase, subunit beta